MFEGILKEVVSKCVDGASVISICEFGDARLIEETGRVFKKDKEMKKGNPLVIETIELNCSNQGFKEL